VRCGWIVSGCVHIKDQDIDGGISKCRKDSAKKKALQQITSKLAQTDVKSGYSKIDKIGVGRVQLLRRFEAPSETRRKKKGGHHYLDSFASH